MNVTLEKSQGNIRNGSTHVYLMTLSVLSWVSGLSEYCLHDLLFVVAILVKKMQALEVITKSMLSIAWSLSHGTMGT